MSYLTQDAIGNNPAMNARVAQAAAEQHIPTADQWTYNNRRVWAAAPGWDEAWDSFVLTHPPVEGEPPPDPGADESVITDGMILAQVQAMTVLPP